MVVAIGAIIHFIKLFLYFLVINLLFIYYFWIKWFYARNSVSENKSFSLVSFINDHKRFACDGNHDSVSSKRRFDWIKMSKRFWCCRTFLSVYGFKKRSSDWLILKTVFKRCKVCRVFRYRLVRVFVAKKNDVCTVLSCIFTNRCRVSRLINTAVYLDVGQG